MKIPITLQLVVIMIGLTAIYTMVGQAVPQKEVLPPEVIEISSDVSSDEMAEIGKEIYEGKGICFTCHANTSRYPDLTGIATRAATRIPGYTALDYLAETLYEPDVYLVEGFNAGMPAVDKPPIGLTEGEILAVMAYLQTLGGTADVTMETKHAYNGGALGGGAAPAEGETAVADAEAGTATGPLATFGCARCHFTDQAGELVEGSPSLWDAGHRFNRDQLLSELIFHEGEPVLGSASQADVQALVDAMSQLAGQG